jgi:hypothetical protein
MSFRLVALTALVAVALRSAYALEVDAPYAANAGPIVVITDMEPDDRIALHLVAALFPDRLALIGTTVMHSYRKKLLAERLMQQLDLGHIPVVQGSGGDATSYPNISSSSAARAYDHEGIGILDEQTLLEANAHARSSQDFQLALRKLLSRSLQVEILVLAPPTDLVQVLTEYPDLAENISQIHLMGGWVEVNTADKVELRTTYNWNMDPSASRQLLAFQDISIKLLSSHTVKRQFSGGSVRVNNYPNLIAALESNANSLPSVADTIVSSRSWDNHVMDQIPALEEIIGRENAGRQFSPADPLIVIAAFSADLAEQESSVAVLLDEQDLDQNRGYRIDLYPSTATNIQLLEKLNEEIFEQVFLKAFESLE